MNPPATPSDSAMPPAAMPASREWGTIRNKDGRFYVRFTAERRQYERGPFTSWNTADKMRRRARSMLEAGTPVADVLAACFNDLSGSTLTFRDAVPLYLAFAAQHKKASTLVGDTSRLSIVKAASWAGKPMGCVTSGELMAWLADRQKRGSQQGKPKGADEAKPLSPASLNRDLTIVSALYRWAKRVGYVDANPAREVPVYSEKGRARETYLTGEESRAFVEACPGLVRPVVLAALHTGTRRGELLALRWKDVDLDRKAIVVRAASEKAGRGRVVPLTEELRLVLTALKKARRLPKFDGSDPVFVDPNGDKRERAAGRVPALGIGALRLGFAAAIAGTAKKLAPDAASEADRKRAEKWLGKRDEVTFHSLRHTAASLMVAAGVPILDVARILGHSTLAVTMRYAHFAPQSGRTAIDALGAALSRTA